MEQGQSRRLLEGLRGAREQCSVYARHLESTYAEREELLYLRKQYDGMTAEITAMRMELVAVRTELGATRRAYADLHVLHSDAERQLAVMEHSASWRFTRPCRAVVSVLRALMRR
jgi:hypothetical protein